MIELLELGNNLQFNLRADRDYTKVRVEAAVLELTVHLCDGAGLAAEGDEAVGARRLRQVVRRPEASTVGARVHPLAHPRRHVEHQAVQHRVQRARCTYTRTHITTHAYAKQDQLLRNYEIGEFHPCVQ